MLDLGRRMGRFLRGIGGIEREGEIKIKKRLRNNRFGFRCK
jgi:hypothetical protein